MPSKKEKSISSHRQAHKKALHVGSQWMYTILVYYYYTTHRELNTNLSTHARKHVHESYKSFQLANMHVCADYPV